MRCQALAVTAISVIGAAAGFAQGPSPLETPSFEVAAIKTLPNPTTDQILSEQGIQIKGDRVHIGPLSLRNLIFSAYRITSHQFDGPDWLTSRDEGVTIFDIDAKLPAGSTADQVPLLLQSLLVERFKLVVQRGRKDADTYALIVGKGGPKFQSRPAAAQTDDATIASGETRGPNGEPMRRYGAARLSAIPGFGSRVEVSSISELMEYLLTRGLSAPVVDKTGLTENFDLRLDLPTPELQELMAVKNFDELRAMSLERLFIAIEKLGLKLDRQKNSVETILVVSAEKVPTEN